jgi:hypothetical protein
VYKAIFVSTKIIGIETLKDNCKQGDNMERTNVIQPRCALTLYRRSVSVLYKDSVRTAL